MENTDVFLQLILQTKRDVEWDSKSASAAAQLLSASDWCSDLREGVFSALAPPTGARQNKNKDVKEMINLGFPKLIHTVTQCVFWTLRRSPLVFRIFSPEIVAFSNHAQILPCGLCGHSVFTKMQKDTKGCFLGLFPLRQRWIQTQAVIFQHFSSLSDGLRRCRAACSGSVNLLWATGSLQ